MDFCNLFNYELHSSIILIKLQRRKNNYTIEEHFDMLAVIYLICTTSLTFGQFPEHIDLQKVSEIMYGNEKYNIFKPKVHVIRDHFKDFIQKRNNINFQTGRVFLDKNGFRHYWKDLEILKQQSYRKADLSKKEVSSNFDQNNKTLALKKTKVDFNITSTISGTENNTHVKIKDKPRRKKKLEADVYVPNKPNLRDNSDVVKTTFFCPFFGVITMSTKVENFDQQK